MSFKRKTLVMSPTKDKTSKLVIDDNSKILHILPPGEAVWGHQHLYVLSHEFVKEGDWCFWLNPSKDFIAKYTKDYEKETARKIIASTDPALNLPMPSKGFIDQYIVSYNNRKPITDILVEYGYTIDTTVDHFDQRREYFLKVNPKDNTITIKKIKNTWDKEELDVILLQVMNLGMDTRQNQQAGYESRSGKDILEQWKNENL